jgi:ubiquinone/menaquinone biosynthesis C-methylase UbiE
MIQGKEEVKNYYKNTNISHPYINERFSNPLGKLMHLKQVAIVNKYVRNQNVLEIACGPGRITKDVKLIRKGVAVDSSDEMLKIARRTLPHWSISKKDAFNLSIEDTFDVVFSFRFLRHFENDDRKRLYKEIHNVLKPNGILIFDAVNFKKSYYVRKRKGLKHYKVYDKLYLKKELFKELKENGFKIIKLVPLLNHLYTTTIISKITNKLNLQKMGLRMIQNLEKIPSSTPLEWIVICKKE